MFAKSILMTNQDTYSVIFQRKCYFFYFKLPEVVRNDLCLWISLRFQCTLYIVQYIIKESKHSSYIFLHLLSFKCWVQHDDCLKVWFVLVTGEFPHGKCCFTRKIGDSESCLQISLKLGNLGNPTKDKVLSQSTVT